MLKQRATDRIARFEGPFSLRQLAYMPFFCDESRGPSDLGSLHESYYPDTPIADLKLPSHVVWALSLLGVESLWQLLSLSPDTFLTARHCGSATLKEVRAALRSFLLEKNQVARGSEIPMDSFASMVDSFLKRVLPDVRAIIIMQQRLGVAGKPVPALKQIGLQFGLSRERIRQLEHKSLTLLKNPAIHQVLASFWQPVFEYLAADDGVRSVYAVSRFLCKRLSWSTEPDPELLAGFLSLHPRITVSHGTTVILSDH